MPSNMISPKNRMRVFLSVPLFESCDPHKITEPQMTTVLSWGKSRFSQDTCGVCINPVVMQVLLSKQHYSESDPVQS